MYTVNHFAFYGMDLSGYFTTILSLTCMHIFWQNVATMIFTSTRILKIQISLYFSDRGAS